MNWGNRVAGLILACGAAVRPLPAAEPPANDVVREIQTAAIEANRSPVAHWGTDPENYKGWGSHSNRLIPIYTFGTGGAGPGVDLGSYQREHSAYRDAGRLRELYGSEPIDTLNREAEYCDQTDLAALQRAALAAGRRYLFLVVFDGMDWQTTRAAAIYKSRCVGYESGRGRGLHFQDYQATGTTQFGFMVTSPDNNGTEVDVNDQMVKNPHGTLTGGYSAERGGPDPWTPGNEPTYLIAENKDDPVRHAYTDSSSSATSLNAGIKTYNNGVNVDPFGRQVRTIAHEAQAGGMAVGAITSVPISHATPASTYAHNVDRDDYQDLTRDLLGRPSVSHPESPLPGLDVVIGAGFGVAADENQPQGANYVPGNIYLTEDDRRAIDVESGGKYVVAQRMSGVGGGENLQAAAEAAARGRRRLLGFYGTTHGHLPFATANGDFQPAPGRGKAETYSPEDLTENPSLSDMTRAAITVLSENPKGFWLMVEAGDVDWANHDNNLDNSIGAVLSGDAAVRVITDWVEQNSNWQEAVVIVTADHGHYLFLDQPERLIPPERAKPDAE